MSPLEKMQEKILEDARAKAEEMLRAATGEGEEIVRKARADAAVCREEELARGREKAEVNRRRIITLAELEARKQVLAAKADLIDGVFSEAAARLASLEPSRYAAYLKDSLLAAAKEGNEEVIMSARDCNGVGREVVAEVNAELAKQGRKGDLRLANSTVEYIGGFVLKSGSVEANCTFDAILAREREAMLVDVAKILFE